MGSTIALFYEVPKDYELLVKAEDRVKVGQLIARPKLTD